MAVLLSYPYGFIQAIQNIGEREYTIDEIAEYNTISGNVYGRNASYIANYAFYSCTSITTASFPRATSIGDNAFSGCTALTTINFPLTEYVGQFAFSNCKSLMIADFPVASIFAGSAFNGCTALTTANCPVATSIGAYAFRNCYNLLSLYLNSVSAVPTLGNSAFYSSPIGGRTTSTGGVYGSVFVPASLYSSFLTARYWSSISARIVSV